MPGVGTSLAYKTCVPLAKGLCDRCELWGLCDRCELWWVLPVVDNQSSCVQDKVCGPLRWCLNLYGMMLPVDDTGLLFHFGTQVSISKGREGSAEIWTRIAGFRVQSANHYTTEPYIRCVQAIPCIVLFTVVFNRKKNSTAEQNSEIS